MQTNLLNLVYERSTTCHWKVYKRGTYSVKKRHITGTLRLDRGAELPRIQLVCLPPPGVRYTEDMVIQRFVTSGFHCKDKSEYDESRLTLHYMQFELTILQFKCHKSTDQLH